MSNAIYKRAISLLALIRIVVWIVIWIAISVSPEKVSRYCLVIQAQEKRLYYSVSLALVALHRASFHRVI